MLTREEMVTDVKSRLNKISDYDLKWMYCYFQEFDEWPIIIDSDHSSNSNLLN